MNPAQLNAWIALFTAAEFIGETVVNGVRALASQALTPEENAQVRATWDDNVKRSAANAGIDPE